VSFGRTLSERNEATLELSLAPSSVGAGSFSSHAFGRWRRISLDEVNRRFNRGGVNLKTEQSLHQAAFQMNERGLLRINVRIGFEPLNGSEDSFSKRTVRFNTAHQHTTRKVNSERG
jgi:hypothetical protein